MKYLVSPFCWYLVAQVTGLLVLLKRASGVSRRLLWALLLVSVLAAIGSLPLLRRVLDAGLLPRPNADSAIAPAFIFVLGGGYDPGERPAEDALVVESQQRVLRAVTLWRQYPDARIVLSGAVPACCGRDAERLGRLMGEAALAHGVPASSLTFEPCSFSTREHPVGALSLPGVTPDVPIAVVSSGWHLRRAVREFGRYFRHVRAVPVLPERRPVAWQDFVPSAGALEDNTTRLREWVGQAWYAILGMRGPPSVRCGATA